MEPLEEDISHDDRRVSELIASLRHVDAPANFETRVRSRIAARGQRGRSFSWTPVLASVTALFLIVVGVYLGTRTTQYVGPEKDVAAVDTAQPSSANVAAPAPQPADRPAAVQNPESVASSKQPANSPAKRRDKNGGGSVDEALSGGTKFFPRGVDPANTNTTDTRGVGSNGQMPITTILSGLGIDASWNGNGWRVNAVTNGSLPERSGLRSGDVIESIDGKTIGEKTVVTGAFNVRGLRVRRDGAPVDIRFKAP
ncbi:MAG TPA: hypothetical protein VL501_03215 [Pyrinomonadaceae bacterium]|nr:hypothetical protein [Pyrinomonadaceae bacterium]